MSLGLFRSFLSPTTMSSRVSVIPAASFCHSEELALALREEGLLPRPRKVSLEDHDFVQAEGDPLGPLESGAGKRTLSERSSGV